MRILYSVGFYKNLFYLSALCQHFYCVFLVHGNAPGISETAQTIPSLKSVYARKRVVTSSTVNFLFQISTKSIYRHPPFILIPKEDMGFFGAWLGSPSGIYTTVEAVNNFSYDYAVAVLIRCLRILPPANSTKCHPATSVHCQHLPSKKVPLPPGESQRASPAASLTPLQVSQVRSRSKGE